MGLKAVFFDLDDTLYTSFQAGDAYAYEKLEEWGHQHVWRQRQGVCGRIPRQPQASGTAAACHAAYA